MKRLKNMICLLLSIVMLLVVLPGCGTPAAEPADEKAADDIADGKPAGDAASELPAVAQPNKKVEKTAVQAQEVRYVPIEEVGSYNEDIITPELLSSCTLPQLDKANLPYWTGLILEDKLSVNYRDDAWDNYTGGSWYWKEDEIRYMAENGFNCVRACYSLSFLSNPEEVELINVSELEQLDELISWCIKYNIHLILSQTGLPGKWNSWGDEWHEDFDYWHNEENVGSNEELYTSTEMQDIYLRYYDMLAKRYQDIPNSILTFELAVENSVPESDMQLQADVLGPVAQRIWSYTPDRIVIVNDSHRVAPVPLAELGCCISLHTHVYSLDGSQLRDEFGVEYDPHWPVQYLPCFIDDRTNPLVIKAEEAFSEGELRLYSEYRNEWPIVLIDGEVVAERSYGEPVYEPEVFSVKIPAGAQEIELQFPNEMGLLGLSFLQSEEMITLASPSIYQNAVHSNDPERMPTLLLMKDLSIADISENPIVVDTQYLSDTYLRPFMDAAAKNGVSFLMTEIGTDQAAALSADEYLAYEACWLDFLQENGISWMYNCIHNILAPEELMWLNETNSPFTDFSDVPNMYGYRVNNEVMNFLKSYSGNR